MATTTRTHLFGDYFIMEVNKDVLNEYFLKYELAVFPSRSAGSIVKPIYSESDIVKFNLLAKNTENFVRLYYLIYCKEEVIGWHFGTQKDKLEYYMINTGILPVFQRKGIYTAALPILIKAILDKGFVTITSHHHLCNSGVLIPKLKAGFFITNVEVDHRFGTLTKLTYFCFENHKKDFFNRCGWKN